MAFDARAATEAASVEYPPFPFIGLDGEEHQIRSLALAGADDLAQLAKLFEQAGGEDGDEDGDDGDTAERLIVAIDILARSAIGEDAQEAVRVLSPLVIGQLIAEWQASSPSLGKSGRPSSPTKKQGRPSKRTPKSAAKKSTASKSTK